MTTESLTNSLNTLSKRQLAVLEFCKTWHGDQKRKYTFDPYWYHVLQVGVLAEEHVSDSLLLEVGLCHDLIEDTKCTADILFGSLLSIGYPKSHSDFITKGVLALSDKYTPELMPKVNRKKRKEMEANRLGLIHWLYQTVKYADLINNTSSIIDHDPSFAKTYLIEKELMLQKMRHGDIELFIKCYQTLKEAKSKINI